MLAASVSLVASQCLDDPANWVDLSGYGCADYAQRQWCNIDGTHSRHWEESWGSISSFAVDGVDALMACCACGGGTNPATGIATDTTTLAHEARTCEDVPDWHDAEDEVCETYHTNQWCTSIGGYGPNWNFTWGTFNDFAYNGVSATSACCACGGGGDPSGRAPAEEAVKDDDECWDSPRGWSDSMERSCHDYWQDNLCTIEGEPGPGWTENAAFSDFATHGLDALHVCCHCGGGSHTDSGNVTLATWSPAGSSATLILTESPSTLAGSTTIAPTYSAPPLASKVTTLVTTARATAAGTTSQMATVERASSSLPDDILPSVTVRVSRLQEVDSTTATCFDVAGWVDTDGEDCAQYAEENYCTNTGDYGDGWEIGDPPNGWGTFSLYWANGYDALAACCACGGGFPEERSVNGTTSIPMHGTTHPGCEDVQDWRDSTGYSCHEYALGEWCQPEGDHYGPGWNLALYGEFSFYANGGYTPLTACCVCGRVGNETTSTSTPTTTQSMGVTAPNCVDISDWTDSEGYDCVAYWSLGWCTTDGMLGPTWEFAWGTFTSYISHGHTAVTACCGCGKDLVNSSTCQDQEGWQDIQEFTCLDYQLLDWCTPDKGYGTGWQTTWGTFQTFAANEVDATMACCACGGEGGIDGFVPLTTPDPGECENLPGWLDSTYFGCYAYAALAWCNSSGQAGITWDPDWGSLGDYADENGVGPAEACCVCGGGSRSGSVTSIATSTSTVSQQTAPITHPSTSQADTSVTTVTSTTATASSSAAALEARQTTRGCKCLQAWKDASYECDSYCCNPDNDEHGLWCLVAEDQKECQGDGWGYCASPDAPLSGTCQDTDATWKDSGGDSCEDYAMYAYCERGGLGSGWEEAWGSLSKYSNQGKDASDVCCICGGGELTGELPGNGEQHCFNFPVLWQDSEGRTCSTYRNEELCSGASGMDEIQIGSDKACCACGGGGTCTDDATWTDRVDRDCRIYAELDWCSELTPDGLGGGWKSEWGTLEAFARDGVSARTACCVCGGGHKVVDTDVFHYDSLTSDGQWHILSGSCTITQDDGCIQSPNYPQNYADSSSCKIAAPSAGGPTIHVEAFNTEQFHDALIVNFVRYSDTHGPEGVVPVGLMEWRTDKDESARGWRLCPVPRPGATGTTLSSGTTLEGFGNEAYPTEPPTAGGWVVAAALVLLGIILALTACWWARSKMSDKTSYQGGPTQRYGRAYDNL